MCIAPHHRRSLQARGPRRDCLGATHSAKQKGRPPLTGKPPITWGNASGRYWDRTSDLFRVREARYRCANRPKRAWVKLDARWRRDSNPCGRLCRPLPRLSATPPLCLPAPKKGAGPPSGRRDSNPRPSPWQGDALPTEPRPRCRLRRTPLRDETITHPCSTLQSGTAATSRRDHVRVTQTPDTPPVTRVSAVGPMS